MTPGKELALELEIEDLRRKLSIAETAITRAVAAEREACAVICDEMQVHYSSYKDTALLNGDVELSIAASGEPRACEFLSSAIRARGSDGPKERHP